MKGLTKEQTAKLKLDIIEYRKQGHVIRECAEHFDVKPSYVKEVCRGIDYPWKRDIEAMKAKAKKWAEEHLDEMRSNGEQTAIAMIADRLPDYEYVGGYVNSEGRATLRCKKCGCVFDRAYVSIRAKQVKCPDCAERELAKKKIEREEQKREARQLKLQQQERLNILKRKCKQISFRTCPICKSVFIGSRKYCSDQCAEQSKWNMKNGYRYKFPLEDVYKRDKGICWLCGGLCDWNDYEVKDGVIVYGNDYPSRDHVIPKSKGGQNTWDNIRLAHRLCNSMKYNRILRPLGQKMA